MWTIELRERNTLYRTHIRRGSSFMLLDIDYSNVVSPEDFLLLSFVLQDVLTVGCRHGLPPAAALVRHIVLRQYTLILRTSLSYLRCCVHCHRYKTTGVFTGFHMDAPWVVVRKYCHVWCCMERSRCTSQCRNNAVVVKALTD